MLAGFFLKLDTLRGAQFADSPLVRRRDNVAFGFAMSWVLKTSDRMVTIAD